MLMKAHYPHNSEFMLQFMLQNILPELKEIMHFAFRFVTKSTPQRSL